MTLAEYEARLAAAAARLPALPQPAADAVRRPEPRLPVRAPLPAARACRGGSSSASWSRTSRSSAGRSAGARSSAGRPSCSIQGTTLVAGGAIAAWMLYIQHQYEDTYYQAAGEWQFELAALQGSSYLQLPARARVGGRQRQLPPRAPPQREDPELPPARRARGAADVRAHARGHAAQQHRRAAAEALGRGARRLVRFPARRARAGVTVSPKTPLHA